MTDVKELDPYGEKPRKQGKLTKLYLGTGGFNIVGKRKIWYAATAVILLICIGSMIWRGFTPSIEFVGGTKIQLPAASAQGTIAADDVKQVYTDTLGEAPHAVQEVGSGADANVEIRSDTLTNAEVAELKDALFEELQPVNNDGQPDRGAISDRGLSGSWGGEITDKALLALGVFLLLVTMFLAFYFERWMAVAALAALGFDLTVSAGVYSLVGFEVTPSTVIGLLTILGFSLYDTVVVFDKVQENTRGLLGSSRWTYGEGANLAVNQTLMRSINTSIIGLLPVAGLLFVGAGLLGVGTLKDLALVLFVGMASGTYSSLFIATPLLVDFKMMEPRYQAHAKRVLAKRAGEDTGTRAARRQAKRAAAAKTSVKAGAGRASDKDELPDDELPEDAELSEDTDEYDDADLDEEYDEEEETDRELAGLAPRPGARPESSRARKRTGGRSTRTGRGGRSTGKRRRG